MRPSLPLNQPRRGGLIAAVLVAAVAASLVAAAGAQLTELGPWYRALVKPTWQPPDWLFPPAWTLIFTLTAIAGVLAWRRAPDRIARRTLIALFALNGVLNMAWSGFFFTWQRPDLALVEVALLWLSILALIVFTARFAKAAGLLLVPYLLWVSFASVLNLAIVRLNGPFG